MTRTFRSTQLWTAFVLVVGDRRPGRRSVRVATIIGLVVLGAGVSTAQAATTYTVTRTDDPSTGTCTPTSCSLRQAVAAAADGDTVSLSSSRSPYAITLGDISTAHAITIQGASAGSSVIQVSGGSAAFNFSNSSGSVTVSGVTIEGGAGGAISSSQTTGSLIVRNSILTRNSNVASGGAIYAAGPLQVMNSTLSQNSAGLGGGAIAAMGVTTISGSTISDNSATSSFFPAGGGIGSRSALYILDSTIDHNTVDITGASSQAEGGGVYHGGSGSLSIENSTIDHNAAETSIGATGSTASGGGVFLNDSAVVPDTILFSTIAGNSASNDGGNIDDYNFGSPPTAQGSIIASGSAPDGADCSGFNPVVQTLGYNVESLDQCDLTDGTDRPNADPKLGPLQANGGPTETMALLAGSPAIELAPATGANCPGADERGITRPRPAGGRCDAGAYEYAPPACQPVSTTTIAGRQVTVQLDCSDPAGVAVTYALDTAPAHGTLSGLDAAGNVTYTPDAGYSGQDSFTYHATSNNGSSATQSVSITVIGRPVISNAHLTNRRFRVARATTAISAARSPFGTKFRFSLSAAGTVTITITHRVPGLRRGSRCIAPTARSRRAHARSCMRVVRVGSLTRAHELQGSNTISFSGRIGHRALALGTYRAILLASNAAGRSKSVALTFVIVS